MLVVAKTVLSSIAGTYVEQSKSKRLDLLLLKEVTALKGNHRRIDGTSLEGSDLCRGRSADGNRGRRYTFLRPAFETVS